MNIKSVIVDDLMASVIIFERLIDIKDIKLLPLYKTMVN